MKKKAVCVMLTMMMLAGCGKVAAPVEDVQVSEQASVQSEESVQEETMAEEQTQEESEDEQTLEDIFEDEVWIEMYEYATGQIDVLRDQIEVTYKPGPKPYPFMSKNNGVENGGYPAYEARYENGQLIIDSEKDDDYMEYYYRLTLSDYEDDCFDKMLITRIWKDGGQEEVIEEHDHDAFMQEFREDVLRIQKDYTFERENNRAKTDVQRNDASEEYGLEVKDRVKDGDYEVISYTNKSYGDATVFAEIIQNGHKVATITDESTLRDSDYERHYIHFYNFEGDLVYWKDYADIEDGLFVKMCRYDEYGNLIYWEDICDGGKYEYDFADENYEYIIRQCWEILCYNSGYRQNW